MAVLVVFCTVYALVMPAVALNGETYCGKTEHTHDKTCYESVLTCGMEEGKDGHVHDDSCYEEQLVCEKEEHTHTDACYVNPDAKEETEAKAESDTASKESDDSTKATTEAKDDSKDATTEASSETTTEEASETTTEDAVEVSTETTETTVSDEKTEGETEEESEEITDAQTKTFKATLDNGIVVTVDVPSGALPDNVTLKANYIGLNTDKNGTVEDTSQQLDKAGIEYDGFLTMDVSFTDEKGEEIEPSEAVSVHFELPETLIPADADNGSLAIQHLSENEDGEVTKVETVADTSQETMKLDEEKLTAQFTVEGFSQFAIVWNTYRGNFKVNVHYVDENGTEIQGTQTENVSLSSGETILFESYAGPIDGYIYSDAHYDRYRGSVVRHMTASSNSQGNYYLTFYAVKNDSYVTIGQLQNGGEADIYLVYNLNKGSTSESINFNDLDGRNNKEIVKFYVNINSQIANSSAGTGSVGVENFTPSVKTTSLSQHPYTFEYVLSGAQYVVIQGASSGSAYAVDQEIRGLGSNNSTDFIIADFPSDEDVFATLRSFSGKNWKDIKVGDTTITSENKDELTTTNYAIRWYVFKYDASDCWHVDGILVPRYGRLTVTKTFDFNQTTLSENDLLAMIPDDFTIGVSSNVNSYSLQMKRATDGDELAHPGWNDRTVNGEEGTVTYTWEVDVLQAQYTITEQNTAVTNYSYSSGTYVISPHSGDSTNGTISDNGFNISCVTTGIDTATAQQSVSLTNSYAKNTGNLTISKNVSGVDEAAVANQQYFFTVTADDVRGELPKIFSDSKQATVIVNGAGTTIITDLPVGNYTVTESQPGNLTGYNFESATYQVGSGSSEETGEVMVTIQANNTMTVTVTNTYTPSTVDITVTKVDSTSSDTTLPNAEFYIAKTVDGANQYYKYDDSTKIVTWVDNINSATKKTSNANGTFTINSLEDGSYILIETKAPDGYVLPSSNFTFSVINGEVHYGDVSNGTEVTVTNTTGQKLPETGGAGTTLITISGLLLMAAAVGGGYGLRRKREERY